MNYFIKETKEYGRGLYATYNLVANRVLFSAELLVLSEKDTIKVNETDLQYYTFKYSSQQDCLVLGAGELFNHSDTPNVGYTLIPYGEGDRQVMVFHILRDIVAGEQLFIDYSADTKVNTNDYTINLTGGK